MRRPVFAALMALTVLSAAGVCAEGQRFVLLSIEDRVGDPEVTAAVETALRAELSALGSVIERDRTRAVLRRLRLRRLEDAEPRLLERLASELEADWLVDVSLQEVQREPAALTLAARAIRGVSGSEIRHALISSTGIEGLHLMGLGLIHELVPLVEREMPRLVSQLALDQSSLSSPRGTRGRRREVSLWTKRIAVIPLTSPLSVDASAAATAGTKALHRVLQEEGMEAVSENAVAALLRRHRSTRWGQLDRGTRASIARELGADVILTGSVDAFTAGWSVEPRPRVAVALRALDAATGRIVWSGELERDGWYRQRAFRRGRVHTRTVLLQELLRRLVREVRSAPDAFDAQEAVR